MLREVAAAQKTVYINYSVNIVLFHPVQKEKKRKTSCLKTRCIPHARFCYHRSIRVVQKKILQRSSSHLRELPKLGAGRDYENAFIGWSDRWKERTSYEFSLPPRQDRSPSVFARRQPRSANAVVCHAGLHA